MAEAISKVNTPSGWLVPVPHGLPGHQALRVEVQRECRVGNRPECIPRCEDAGLAELAQSAHLCHPSLQGVDPTILGSERARTGARHRLQVQKPVSGFATRFQPRQLVLAASALMFTVAEVTGVPGMLKV